ncbi:hypothetical protein RJT34_15939 [Clitoria ternatea]|uniref:Uncharacterized protein n=1 Tax=Clitoria ternatea TaxID=43366 RepID=A0AAN9J6I4_CLITE
MEEPTLTPIPVPAPAPALAPILAPADVEMADPTDLPPLPVQLSPSEFRDMVAASIPHPLVVALAVEPLGMYIPDMQMEDLTPLVALIVSLIDGFLARRQWDQSHQFLRHVFQTYITGSALTTSSKPLQEAFKSMSKAPVYCSIVGPKSFISISRGMLKEVANTR